jgi:predicted nuclease of predicted toxin-antitoxin system
MRFLVDESTGPAVARWLRENGHDVFSVFEQARGLEDDKVIDQAYHENRILITNDKDFGEKVFREKKPHHGVILLRLEDERSTEKIKALNRLIEYYSEQLPDRFAVVTEERIRLSKR